VIAVCRLLSATKGVTMKDFSQIKVLVCDCDGVLTDGLIIYDSTGVETKHFSAHDGMGFHILRHTNIIPVVITGRVSKNLELRCADLSIKYLFQGVKNKAKVLAQLLDELGLTFDNVAYIGDDWNDFLAMSDCYLRIAPKNARDSFKMTVDYITEHVGGDGAVRDAIEYILISRHEFDNALRLFLNDFGQSV